MSDYRTRLHNVLRQIMPYDKDMAELVEDAVLRLNHDTIEIGRETVADGSVTFTNNALLIKMRKEMGPEGV